MKIFVAGGSGATGQLLVKQLLEREMVVKTVVRSIDRLPEDLRSQERLTISQGTILDMDQQELVRLIKDCDAITSCLGHTMSFRGVYGAPRKLVRDSLVKLGSAVQDLKPGKPVKMVLMNTAGNHDEDNDDKISKGQKLVLELVRMLVPPHVDNEQAADYLRIQIGQGHQFMEWVVVRPDSLIDQDEVTEYQIYPSPTRSAIFNPGKTSRINVAHFMAKLIANDDLWKQWKGQMPVIYNS